MADIKRTFILFCLICLISLFCLTFYSCSGEKNFSSQELYEMAQKKGGEIKLLLPDKNVPAVTCDEYGPECLTAITVQIKGLNVIAVKFTSTKAAFTTAGRIDAYHFHNWLFDDVTGEPILEDFFMQIYGAQRVIPEVRKDSSGKKQP